MHFSVLSVSAALVAILLACATTPSQCKDSGEHSHDHSHRNGSSHQHEDEHDDHHHDDEDDDDDENVQLSFPLVGDHTAYAVIEDAIPHALKELTLCHWVRIFNLTHSNMVFQYSVKDQPRAIASYVNPNQVYFDVGLGAGKDIGATLPTNPRNGEWHHFCFTWSAYTGSVEIYQNGKKIKTETGKGLGRPVAADGVAVLGVDQSSPGIVAGTAATRHTFKGDISEVQLWNHVLCADQIADLANCTSELEGNVISWSDAELVTFNGAEETPLDNLCPKCKSK